MIRHPQIKGSSFERKIAKMFSEAFNIQCRRTPMSGGFSPDLAGDLRVIGNSPLSKYHFELKKRKRISFEKWFLKAQGEANQFIPYKTPIIVVGLDRNNEFVIMSLKDWISLLKSSE